MASYFQSLSPSFSEKVIEDFAPRTPAGDAFLNSFTEKFPTVDSKLQEVYANGLQGFDSPESFFPSQATSALASPAASNSGWTFITAPEDVSWDVANQATRVDIFGSNNPPVVAGSRGMRDLTLSNSLVEGFQRNKNVEAKVASLEALMNYGLNASEGFVSVPVYQVWANSKSYGGSNAYFIIKDVKVKETMRDIQGNSTRAYVDISLMQVPAYQVNSGRDQASQATAGAGKILQDQAKASATTGTSGATAANAAAKPANQGVGTPAKPAAGPKAPAQAAVGTGKPLAPNQAPTIALPPT